MARGPARHPLEAVNLVFDLTRSVTAPAQARRVAARLAADLRPDTFAALRIVVSELVSNAVKYGPGSPIHVEIVVLAPGHVRGEVADRGSAGTPAAGPRIDAQPGAHGGFGLRMVDRLTTSWGVRPGSSHVWFELGG
jgi:two-component sensor histidine kinase